MGLLNTNAGRVSPRDPPPCLYTAVPHTVFSVAVDLVLLTAEDSGTSHNAVGQGIVGLRTARARAGETLTYMRAVGGASGGLAARLGAAGVASSAYLLVVELEVFQPLRESQLLLDGHSQQRVEGLLLILCRSQLPLHLFQLSDVLVTTAGREGEKNTGKMG